MKWIIEFVDYEAVEDMCRQQFGVSQYTDKWAGSLIKRKLAQTDKVDGDTVYKAKRNLVNKIGNNRIEIMSVTPA